MKLLLDSEGRIIATADSIEETDNYFIVNDGAFMKGDFCVADVGSIQEGETHFVNGKFGMFSRSKIKQQTQAINDELAELDKEIPRIVEDMIATMKSKPYAIKQAIIDRKQALRNNLKNL